MSDKPGSRRDSTPSETLKTLAHDLGNLAYRLEFLRLNLAEQIPDTAQRSDAEALLQDTTESLRRVIESLREVKDHV